jgi:hypothetical protein
MAAKKASRSATRRAKAEQARAAQEAEGTTRLYLRTSVGSRKYGGKYYGPGWADVPNGLAKSLIANGASTEGPPDAGAAAGASGAPTATESKRATKTALTEFGDADALRTLAKQHGVDVEGLTTKSELVDAIYESEKLSADDVK